MKTLRLLLQAVQATYPNDPTAPGVVVSYLTPSPEVFYVAIVRYRDRFGGGKYVVAKARNLSLLNAVRAVSAMWLPTTPQAAERAQEALRKVLP